MSGPLAAVWQREFLGYFRTPVAYVVIAAFLLAAVGLPWFIGRFFEGGDTSLAGFFGYLPWVFACFVPAVAMRLWAEERKTGTWELLLTLPVSPVAAVTAKFLAGWLFIAIALLGTAPLVATVCWLGDPDPGPIATGAIMALLLAGANLAVNMAASALTRNQVVGYVLGLLINLALIFTGWSVFGRTLDPLPVALTDAIANFSTLTHFESGPRGLLTAADAGFFAVLIAAGLAITVRLVARGQERGAGRFGRDAAVAWATIAGAVLAAHLPGQLDATEDRFFTLTEPTLRVAAGLDAPVTLEFHFSRNDRDLPIRLKNFAARVEGLLRQYERAGGGRIRLRLVTPEPDSPEAAEAARLGLAPLPRARGGAVFFGLAAIQGPRRQVLPAFDPGRETLLEHDITRLLRAVVRPRPPVLGILGTLPLFGDPEVPPPQRRDEDGTAEWHVVRDLRQLFEVVAVDPTAADPLAGVDVFLLVNPGPLDGHFGSAFARHLAAGRPAVIAVDPSNFHERARRRHAGLIIGARYYERSDLPDWFVRWGLTLVPDRVVADRRLATPVPPDEGLPPADYPFWLTLPDPGTDEPAVAGLHGLILAESGSLRIEPVPGITARPLVRSSSDAALVPAAQVDQLDPYEALRRLTYDAGEQILAVELRGHLPTPHDPPDRPADGPHATVIVIADADFLADSLTVEAMRVAGVWQVRPASGNIAFTSRILEHLVHADGAAGMVARRPLLRPFTVVAELKRQAAERLRAEQERVDASLEAARRRIEELRADAGRAADAGSLRRFQHEMERARRELARSEEAARWVQRQSQLEVQALERRLTLLNLGLVPALTLIAGLVVFAWRHRSPMQPRSLARSRPPLSP